MKYAGNRERPQSEREIEIEKKLRTPVSLQFTNAPLSQVMSYLAKLAEVNLHLDPTGLAEEGVTTDTPVTINLPSEIMLKSALNLILDPLHLSYVIKDEVLKVTSEQMRDGQVYTQSVPRRRPGDSDSELRGHAAMGLAGAYTTRHGGRRLRRRHAVVASSTSTPMSVVSNSKHGSMATNAEMLAQQMAGGARQSRVALGRAKELAGGSGAGPGGLGGGAQPDFDSLIDLITSTVKPTTWDGVGGPGSIAPFETNLSIVVSQTQDVHEEIVDLLEQLRRLQDLQVTIEVRFITLNDNFFERIGVSFDFDIKDNVLGKGITFGAGTPPPNATGQHQLSPRPLEFRTPPKTPRGRSPSA